MTWLETACLPCDGRSEAGSAESPGGAASHPGCSGPAGPGGPGGQGPHRGVAEPATDLGSGPQPCLTPSRFLLKHP